LIETTPKARENNLRDVLLVLLVFYDEQLGIKAKSLGSDLDTAPKKSRHRIGRSWDFTEPEASTALEDAHGV
jgi:hypothetical protein